MYRNTNREQLEFPDFYLPFNGHLDPENRWVALAELPRRYLSAGFPVASTRTCWSPANTTKVVISLSRSKLFVVGSVVICVTSAAQISLSFLMMNLERDLRQLFLAIFLLCHALGRVKNLQSVITQAYSNFQCNAQDSEPAR